MYLYEDILFVFLCALLRTDAVAKQQLVLLIHCDRLFGGVPCGKAAKAEEEVNQHIHISA